MDKTEVKKILQWKTTKHDDYLDTMVPLLEEWVKEYANQDFKNALEETEIPSGVKIFIAKACEYNVAPSNLQSRNMGSVSYTYNLDFPPSILRYLKPHRRLKFRVL